MDSRQQFEDWYTTYERRREANGWMPLENYIVRHMRESWQASRESLVVELPDDGMEDCQREWGEGCKDTFDCGYNFSCAKHEQAIHEAGIRTK